MLGFDNERGEKIFTDVQGTVFNASVLKKG